MSVCPFPEVAGGGAAADEALRAAENEPWQAPPLTDSVLVRRRGGERISLEALAGELASADVVFLGESHTDEATHRLQHYLFAELLRIKDGRVVLAMEMFHRDDQEHLDAFLAGRIREEEFGERVRLWSNYREAYRPLILSAKSSGAPVVGSNFPNSLLRRFAAEGASAAEGLTKEERRLVPERFLPNTEAYWRRVDNATRGHSGMFGDAKDPDARLYSVQSLWDNAMGDACVLAKRAHPDHVVLHINGGFHSAYGGGAAHQVRSRDPDLIVKTVSIAPAINPSTVQPRGKEAADYTAVVEARASNIEQGKRSVTVARGLEYVLHTPPERGVDASTPLLIWLADDGLSADEVMPYCVQQFGDRAAIVVVDPPHRVVGEDLAVGGRWFWQDTFSDDIGIVSEGVERIWAYVCRHFRVDPDQTCLVGEGDGATVVAAIAARTDRVAVTAIAINPRRFGKLKDLPLLLPELYEPGTLPRRSLAVHAPSADKTFWEPELDEFASVGVGAELVVSDGGNRSEAAAKSAVLAALAGSSVVASGDPPTRFIRLKTESPRERLWARLQAAHLTKDLGLPIGVASSDSPDGTAETISREIQPSSLQEPGVLPRCPGPFGGTTVILMPPGISAEQRQRWLAIEQNDPLNANSRFYRVRMADLRGEFGLAAVLQKLSSENRTNVLIAPACFYAGGDQMRAARVETKPFEDRMTIQWSPGLGNRPGILAER